MAISWRWRREAGARLQGSRDLDTSKLQAPCIVRIPGGYRLFYTAVGPAKPFPECQGYILSAVSGDGLSFQTEPGIRVAPHPELPWMSLRVIAPTITPLPDGRWRMYFESRGPATRPTVICSAVSSDLLQWDLEPGIRLETSGGVGGPRYLRLPDGRGRLYCFARDFGPGGMAGGKCLSTSVLSAVTSDGLQFQLEDGIRLRDKQGAHDSAGITAAEVIAPIHAGGPWTMVYSAWQDLPPGSVPVLHPSHDKNAVVNGQSVDFAKASIACDMSGYRSRIFLANSGDGLTWTPTTCVIDGAGYHREGIDAVHAEDMSLISLGDGTFRMYYAACDQAGNWRIASATGSNELQSQI